MSANQTARALAAPGGGPAEIADALRRYLAQLSDGKLGYDEIDPARPPLRLRLRRLALGGDVPGAHRGEVRRAHRGHGPGREVHDARRASRATCRAVSRCHRDGERLERLRPARPDAAHGAGREALGSRVPEDARRLPVGVDRARARPPAARAGERAARAPLRLGDRRRAPPRRTPQHGGARRGRERSASAIACASSPRSSSRDSSSSTTRTSPRRRSRRSRRARICSSCGGSWACMTNAFIARGGSNVKLKVFKPGRRRRLRRRRDLARRRSASSSRAACSAAARSSRWPASPARDRARAAQRRADPLRDRARERPERRRPGLLRPLRGDDELRRARSSSPSTSTCRSRAELISYLSTEHRKAYFFANASARRQRRHPRRGARAAAGHASPAPPAGGAYRVPLKLLFRIDLYRGSDNVLMASSLVRKSLNVPGCAKAVLAEVERFLRVGAAGRAVGRRRRIAAAAAGRSRASRAASVWSTSPIDVGEAARRLLPRPRRRAARARAATRSPARAQASREALPRPRARALRLRAACARRPARRRPRAAPRRAAQPATAHLRRSRSVRDAVAPAQRAHRRVEASASAGAREVVAQERVQIGARAHRLRADEGEQRFARALEDAVDARVAQRAAARRSPRRSRASRAPAPADRRPATRTRCRRSLQTAKSSTDTPRPRRASRRRGTSSPSATAACATRLAEAAARDRVIDETSRRDLPARREAQHQLRGALGRAEAGRRDREAAPAHRVDADLEALLALAEQRLGSHRDVAEVHLALHHAAHAHREQLAADRDAGLLGAHRESDEAAALARARRAPARSP